MPFTTHLTSKIAAFNTNEEDGETKAGTDLPFVSPANTTASNKSLLCVYCGPAATAARGEAAEGWRPRAPRECSGADRGLGLTRMGVGGARATGRSQPVNTAVTMVILNFGWR